MTVAGFPAIMIRQNGGTGFTAAGTVPDFHRVPFSLPGKNRQHQNETNVILIVLVIHDNYQQKHGGMFISL
jgi:hypothetical protein